MMTQEIIKLFDAYTHGLINRRDFMSRLAILAGSVAAATRLLSLLENDYRLAGVGARSSGEEWITFPGASGPVRAFSVQPEFEGPYAAVIVIHENRGLNPYIQDVTRRLAMAGFWAISPDALSPLGGTPEDQDRARDMLRELDNETTIGDFIAAVRFASDHPQSTGKVGCVGFCWGGSMSNQLAVRSPELRAAVAFYGSQPDPAQVSQIKAAVMLHYAGLDDRINAGIPAYVAALEAANVEYTMHMYENVHHAFHNHTSRTRYNKEAADLAWQRTITFFNVHLL